MVKVVLWSRGAHLTKPGWSKPHTHSNPTNLALFRHKITLYRFKQGGGFILLQRGSNGSRGAEPPSPLTLTTAHLLLWYSVIRLQIVRCTNAYCLWRHELIFVQGDLHCFGPSDSDSYGVRNLSDRNMNFPVTKLLFEVIIPLSDTAVATAHSCCWKVWCLQTIYNNFKCKLFDPTGRLLCIFCTKV